MRQQKLLELLRTDVEAWNGWREENPNKEIRFDSHEFENLDLSHANLRHADLGYCHFRWCNLSYTDLRGADLHLIQIEECSLFSTLIAETVLDPRRWMAPFLRAWDKLDYVKRQKLITWLLWQRIEVGGLSMTAPRIHHLLDENEIEPIIHALHCKALGQRVLAETLLEERQNDLEVLNIPLERIHCGISDSHNLRPRWLLSTGFSIKDLNKRPT